jgi:hypothetical protein
MFDLERVGFGRDLVVAFYWHSVVYSGLPASIINLPGRSSLSWSRVT